MRRRRNVGKILAATPLLVSSPPRPVVMRPRVVVARRIPSALSMIEDNRRFHPLGLARPPRGLFLRPRIVAPPIRRRKVSKAVAPFRVPAALGFQLPDKVVRCIRRKSRREVLFALHRTGKGSRTPKRRNMWSEIHC